MIRSRQMARPIIFLTHTDEARERYYGDEALAALRQSGELRMHRGETPLSGEALAAAARGADIIVCDRNTPGAPVVFQQLEGLVAFVRGAVDIRTISVDDASKAGVLVTRASAGFMASVSEWIIGAMIDAARGIAIASEAYHAERMPPPQMGKQLSGSIAGVIGYGQISRHLCPILRALGMRVLVCDPHAPIDDPDLTSTDLPVLLASADFVICLAAATPETENLMDAAAFSRMKRDAFFINAARGNLVDEAALEAALNDRRIAGAALDVGRAPDQMPSPLLARRVDVVATPHIGGLTPQAVAHQAMETTRQVAAIVAGEIPAGAVNAEHAHRMKKFRSGR
jgi:D-3-phosphoglycerate dehydrogenase / 2-oxoglutarate reductase